MFVQLCPKSDAVKAEKVLSVAFESSRDMSKIEPEDFQDPSAPIYGAYTGTGPEDPGELTSVIVFNRYEMYFDGKPVKCIGIGGVSSLPQYRRNGGIRAIFTEGFKIMKEEDCVFASLFPFSYEYYNKFGFQATSQVLNIRVPMTELTRYEPIGDCYLVESKEDENIRALYEEHASKHNLALTGACTGWRRYGRDPYLSTDYVYVYLNPQGVPSGYFKYNPHSGKHGEGERIFHVTELYYRSVEDLKGIFGFIGRFCSHHKVLFDRIPLSEDFSLLFKDYYSVDRNLYFNSMARVVVAERAFELMRYPKGKGTFALKITDRTCPWNNGVFTVTYRNGKPVSIVHTEDGDWDASVTDTALARVMLGTDGITSNFLSFEEGLEIRSNRETLEKVFSRKPQILYDSF